MLVMSIFFCVCVGGGVGGGGGQGGGGGGRGGGEGGGGISCTPSKDFEKL